MHPLEATPGQEKNFRFRSSYQKLGDMRFLAHLELATRIRRAMLQAGIPVSVAPKSLQPQISFGPALAMNVESRGELIDFFTHHYCPPKEIMKRINALLPPQLHFLEIVPISKSAPSLSIQINGADYSVDLRLPENSLAWNAQNQELAIQNFLGKEEILTTKFKTGKSINIRRFVRDLKYDPIDRVLWIEMDINGGRTVGIMPVMNALYGSYAEWRICRERLYIRDGRQKKSPLTLEWEQIQMQRHMMDMAQ